MKQRFLIYGGSGGIGSALARQLHAQGHDLHLAGRNQAALTQLSEELGAKMSLGDVTDPSFFAQVAQEAGDNLSGLIYAVGTIQLKSIQRLQAEDYLNDFRVNALGAALAVQASLPALKRSPEGASVLLFSSIAAQQGFSFHASIGMAKAAIEGLTLSLAAELAPKIRVNAIAPSLTDTPLAKGLLANEQTASSIAAMHPMQRIGQAQDIAGLAAFLLSPAANWITGQIMAVDGGRSSLRPKG